MNAIRLATWRDAALALLAVQAILLTLVPAVALYWGLRGLRRLRQWLRPVLFQTRLHVWKAQHETRRVMNALAAPFVWLQGTVAGLLRMLQMLSRR